MDKGITILNTNYSMNIARDFNNHSKINSYIPSIKNIQILEKFLKNFNNKKNGSYLISGAYGTGKSFFISVLLHLLKNKDFSNLEILLNKFEQKYSLTSSLEKIKDQEYLIVFGEDSFKSFSQSILAGINKALAKENINIYLNTEFKSILNKIENWANNFPHILSLLEKQLKLLNMDLEYFKRLLNNYDYKAIEIFKNIYPDIFAGEEYVSLYTNNNLIDILQELEFKLKHEYNYKGIIYIFDEFGRYLESNISTIDVKEIQDMAEYANGLDNNSYFFLISHKDIFQYTNKLSKKENISEWEKVSGRFQKEHLAFEKNTTLNILSETLYKNENYKIYKNHFKKDFEIYFNNLSGVKLIEENKIETTLDNFYPLNYLSAYMLPDLSQKVAQNERTLFAFLGSTEDLALSNILKNNFLINLNHLFDYFEENFKLLNHDTSEYKVYLNTKILLEKTEDILEIKLLKIISLIYIYNKFREVKPTKEFLQLALNVTSHELEKTLNSLISKNFIRYQRHFKYYKLIEETDLNIEKEISDYIQEKLKLDSYSNLLNEYLPLNVFYPLSYNEKFDVSRFLKMNYLDASEITLLDNYINNEFSDGNIIFLTNINKNPNFYTIKEALKNLDLILVTNKENIPMDISYFLKELKAIDNLLITDKKFQSKVFKKELLSYKNEVIEEIKNKLSIYFSKDNIDIHSLNEKYSSTNFLQITDIYLSKKYINYIPLNYELINKHNLSSPMKKVRNILLDDLLNNNSDLFKKTFFQDTNAKGSVARIVLGNFIDNEEIIFPDKYAQIYENIMNDISQGNITFSDLYNNYCTDKLGYGFRKGFFTFFLGIIFGKHKNTLSIISSENKNELEINGMLFDKIEKNPEKYIPISISLQEDEENFINNLYELIENYSKINPHLKKSENILEGFRQYFYSLPRFITSIYLKETKVLSKLLNTIFQDKNAYEFLLKEIPKRAREKNLTLVLEILKEDLKYNQEKINFYREALVEVIIENISSEDSTDISQALEKFKISRKVTSNSFQSWLINYTFENIPDFLEDITKRVKGFSYENWMTEKDLDDFSEKLKKLLDIPTPDTNTDIVELSINGQKNQFNINTKKSQMGELLKKKLESDIKNMGITVNDDEKKLILIEILSKF